MKSTSIQQQPSDFLEYGYLFEEEHEQEFNFHSRNFATESQEITHATSTEASQSLERQLREILTGHPSPYQTPIMNTLLSSAPPQQTFSPFAFSRQPFQAMQQQQMQVFSSPAGVSTPIVPPTYQSLFVAMAPSSFQQAQALVQQQQQQQQFQEVVVSSTATSASSTTTSSSSRSTTTTSTPTEEKKKRPYKSRCHYIPTREELEQYFDIPLSQAAKKFDICTSKMKKICRSYGIMRWPYSKSKTGTKRKIEDVSQSVEDEESSASDSDSNQSATRPAPFANRTFSPASVPATPSTTSPLSETTQQQPGTFIGSTSRIATSPTSSMIVQQLVGSAPQTLSAFPSMEALTQIVSSAIANITSTQQDNKIVHEIHVVHHFRPAQTQTSSVPTTRFL